VTRGFFLYCRDRLPYLAQCKKVISTKKWPSWQIKSTFPPSPQNCLVTGINLPATFPPFPATPPSPRHLLLLSPPPSSATESAFLPDVWGGRGQGLNAGALLRAECCQLQARHLAENGTAALCRIHVIRHVGGWGVKKYRRLECKCVCTCTAPPPRPPVQPALLANGRHGSNLGRQVVRESRPVNTLTLQAVLKGFYIPLYAKGRHLKRMYSPPGLCTVVGIVAVTCTFSPSYVTSFICRR
jgi:hypothetical protein